MAASFGCRCPIRVHTHSPRDNEGGSSRAFAARALTMRTSTCARMRPATFASCSSCAVIRCVPRCGDGPLRGQASDARQPASRSISGPSSAANKSWPATLGYVISYGILRVRANRSWPFDSATDHRTAAARALNIFDAPVMRLARESSREASPRGASRKYSVLQAAHAQGCRSACAFRMRLVSPRGRQE